MQKLKIALVLGTRPEIIKLSPVIRLLKKKRIPFFVVHTGQHYTYEMDKLFFDELDLPRPTYNLNIRSSSALRQGEHAGKMLIEIEKVLLREKPTHVLVQGDTNSVLAGALAVAKIRTSSTSSGIQMKLCHVEAGLRSFDRSMPEEINRIVADQFSQLHFAPTPLAVRLLVREGIRREGVFMTGNTVVDALKQNLKTAQQKLSKDKRGLKPKTPYLLMTLHRQENVDNRKRLSSILDGLNRVVKHTGLPIIFPAHPRTVKNMKQFGLKFPKGIIKVDPVGYLNFLVLESKARLILTDSGGVQEEACILKVPCVTLRTSTERPETLTVKANRLAGYQPLSILKAVQAMTGRKRSWRNPFGDGRASERIVAPLRRRAL